MPSQLSQFDLVEACTDSYTGAIPLGYSLFRSFPTTGLGGNVIIYQRGEGASLENEFIVAFRGTEPQADDGYADLGIGWDQWLQISDQIASFLTQALIDGSQLHFVGHSLGGALAQYAAYAYQSRAVAEHLQPIFSLETVNALGGIAGLRAEFPGSFDENALSGHPVVHYFVDGDFVSRLGEGHLGGNTLQIVDSTRTQPHSFLSGHVMTTVNAMLSNDDFSSAQPATPDYLDHSSIQPFAYFIADLMNGDGQLATGEAELRIALGLLAVNTVLSLPASGVLNDEFRQLMQALFRNLGDAEPLGSEGSPLWYTLEELPWGNPTFHVVLPVVLAGALGYSVGDLLNEVMQRHGIDLSQLLEETGPISLFQDAWSLSPIALLSSFLADQSDENGVSASPVELLEGTSESLVLNMGSVSDAVRTLLLRIPNDSPFTLSGAGLSLVDGSTTDYRLMVPVGAMSTTINVIAGSDPDSSSERSTISVLTPPIWDVLPNLLESLVASISVVVREPPIEHPFVDGTAADDRGGDAILGDSNSNTMHGLGGDDDLLGRGGDDVIFGDDGDDLVLVESGNTTVEGGAGRDILQAQGGGTASLSGGDGDDFISGSNDVEILQGGYDDDVISGAGGDDTIEGGEGDDLIFADGAYTIIANPAMGEDNRDWSVTVDSVTGEFEFNLVFGSPNSGSADGSDFVDAGGGNDIIFGGGGDDFILAGPDLPLYGLDADRVIGGAGNDYIEGGAANDILSGDDSNEPGLVGNDIIFGQFGDDQIRGGLGDDLLYGGDGDDVIAGDRDFGDTEGGNDFLDGGAGNDALDAGGGDDGVTGDEGNDNLIGGAGNDRLWGEDGDDQIQGGADNDTIWAGEGNDIATGGEGNDELSGSGGVDTLAGDAGDDRLDGGDGDDQLQGGTGNDRLVGGDGADQLFGEDGTDTLDGGLGNDNLIAGAGDDSLSGGSGNDQLFGQAGIDTLSGGSGNDQLQGGNDADTLRGDAGNDLLFGEQGADSLQGGDGDDQLQGGTENDQLFGDAGNDILAGQDGNDALAGGAGTDDLFGDSGDDDLHGGAGDDYMTGGTGNDLYRFNTGDGVDIVYPGAESAAERIVFGAGITPADITFARHGTNSLAFLLPGGQDALVINGWYASAANRIGTIEFADGTIWTPANVPTSTSLRTFIGDSNNNSLTGTTSADSLYGYAGNDTLTGNSGNDLLVGGLGNDTLNGGNGADTYLIEAMDGSDIITNAATDTVQFGLGVTASDLSYERSENDLLIRWGSNVTTMWDWYAGGAPAAITFAGGSSAPSISEIGTLGQNVASNYQFARGTGIRTLSDWGDFDTLTFGTGIQPADVTASRTGLNLVLTVGPGSTDQVVVTGWFNGPINQIEEFRFSDSATIISADSLTANLLTLVGTAGNETVSGSDYYGETLNGLAGNDTLRGNGGDDTLQAGLGNDALQGGLGNDLYLFNRGDGVDVITEAGGTDTLRVEIAGAEVSATTTNTNLVLTFSGSADQITIVGQSSSGFGTRVENIEFVTRATDAAETIGGSGFNDIVYGFGGNDSITGGLGRDTLDGGAGIDTIDGGEGGDTLIGGAGDDIVGGAFSTSAQSDYGSASNTYEGGAGNDTLNGTMWNDVFRFNLGDGADRIIETPVNTTSIGNSNADQVVFGPGILPEHLTAQRSGDDLIVRYSATDSFTVVGWFLDYRRQVERFYFTIGGVPQQLMTDDDVQRLAFIQNGTAGNDVLNGDGTYGDSLFGLGGADQLFGNGGADLLDGGAGNDTLDGGSGSDVFVFGPGYGSDLVIDDGATSYTDVVRLAATVSPSMVTYSRSGNDIVLALSSGEQLRIRDGMLPSRPIEQITFLDGSAAVQVSALVDALITVNGTASDDVLTGSTGTDIMNGYSGNDVLDGIAGDDTINAGDGNDRLIVGAGQSLLLGGAGDDAYVFTTRVYGTNTIRDAEGMNRIVLPTGATPATVWPEVQWHGATADLRVQLDSPSDSTAVFVENGYTNGNVEFQLADGRVLSFDQFVQELNAGGRLLPQRGTFEADTIVGSARGDALEGQGGDDHLNGGAGDDLIRGGNEGFDVSSGNDLLEGGSGNDTLIGQDGDDVLDGGAGNDSLQGGTGVDTFLFSRGMGSDTVTEDIKSLGTSTIEFAAGISPTEITVAREGKNLVIRMAGSNETMTVQGWVAGGSRLPVSLVFADGTAFSATDLESGAIKLGTTGADTLRGGGGNDLLFGAEGNDRLLGKGGADFLNGGGGDDRMEGGAGDDTYAFNNGWGHDVVAEGNSGSGNDTILFGPGVTLDQLTFLQSGNNMVVSTGDGRAITVENWFLGAANQIETFRDSTGNSMLASQVEALVQASAAFVPMASAAPGPDPTLKRGVPDDFGFAVDELSERRETRFQAGWTP